MNSSAVLSAHSTIAKFCGVDEHNMARFGIVKYLRYAFLQEGGQGLQEEFVLDLATADAQVGELAEEAEGVLSAVVSEFTAGDRIELDWIEVRLPSKSESSSMRSSSKSEADSKVVLQCQALGKLSADAEAALLKQYPFPQIMSRKLPATSAIGTASIMGFSEQCGACSEPISEPPASALPPS
jgi:hypothetical protein